MGEERKLVECQECGSECYAGAVQLYGHCDECEFRLWFGLTVAELAEKGETDGMAKKDTR